MCIADELAPALRRGAQAINGFVCGVFLKQTAAPMSRAAHPNP